ncbi:MAG: hypothetical protein A2099_07230 [Planctomycetes bacterium GWF2_39_10]|nr:MAG: hypothetical protein A2099_07230 [Planctomycetes bacterium GWF2_39_10]
MMSTDLKKYNKLLYISFFLFFVFQLLMLDILVPSESEGWFSDIAYNINWQFNGRMAKDIPYGAAWSSGQGKIYFLIHYIFYKILGSGVFQARLVTFVCGVGMLILLYKWTLRYISKEVAIFSTFLLIASPLYYLSLPDARTSVIHCLFGLLSFYFISSGFLTKKNYYFIAAGFVSAMSVDIDYRGIEIVLAIYIFHCVFFGKGAFLKYLLLLLIGTFIYFVIWFSINVLPMGIENFIKYNLIPTSGEGDPFSIETLLSEVNRFINNLTGKRKYFTIVEVLYLTFLSICFYKYRSKYNKVSKIVFSWILICFVIMSLVERRSYIPHLLMYSPFICILSGIGLYELFNCKKKIASIVLVSIVFFSFVSQGGILLNYVYQKYYKKDYDIKGYYLKLRESVDVNKNILGQPQHWYAFLDSQYYGGNFYLGRVMGVLKEIRPPNEYNNDYDRAKAMLKVLEKRKIEYIIADEDFKLGGLMCYFPNKELPKKNFLLVDTIDDMFLGRGNSQTPPYTTEIYKVISYEP